MSNTEVFEWLDDRLGSEIDNLMYLGAAMVVFAIAGWGNLNPAGVSLGNMIVGALLIKVKA